MLQRMLEKRDWKVIQKYSKEKNYKGLLLLAIYTKNETVMTEAIQNLYQTGDLEFLNDLYHAVSSNQNERREVLYSLYEEECKKIQCEFMKEKGDCSYEKKLQLMLNHTLSTPSLTPAYGSLLSDLVISAVSCSTLVIDTDLILNNYPEKEKSIRTRLMKDNQWQNIFAYIQLLYRRTGTLDLSLTSYLFYQLESIYWEAEPSKEMIEMYESLKSFVLEHNHQVENEWEEEKKPLFGIISDLKNPEVPILSILSTLPVTEEIKETIIGSLDCDGVFKEEMLKAFRNRNQNPDACSTLDVYYVLNQNYVSKPMDEMLEQQFIEKVKNYNQNYYNEMRIKKRMGLVNAEDVIGAIGELEARPIFGLFSLLKEVPLEDLLVILSNISFEDVNERACLIHYLNCVHEVGEKAYTPEYVKLDLSYVMNQLKEQNSLLDEKPAKKKEF